MQGVRCVVHLAGCTTDADMEAQIAGNIRGAFNVFEAARDAGVQRVVYASSHHVVGYYPRNRRIGSHEGAVFFVEQRPARRDQAVA